MAKRCKAAFSVITNGVPRVIADGAILSDDDPVIKGREASFEDVGTYVERVSPVRTETATAAPGELRGLGPKPAAPPVAPPAPPKSEGK